MNRLTWRFTALDSWFFKESRPFDSIGGSELNSVFPPSPATMAGAIRSVIGNHQNIDWKSYPQHYPELQKQIGDSDSLGAMRLKGTFLSRKISGQDWERLYPVPAHLVAAMEKAEIKELHFLQVGNPVHCDLGEQVCLAVAPVKGIKTLEDYWLTQAGLNKVLTGQLPDKTELIKSDDLFHSEARLGIARSNQSRTVIQGNLYQTQHIRPKAQLAVEVDIDGLDGVDYPNSGIVRLGGEGRGAAFSVVVANSGLASPDFPATNAADIKLVLLSAVAISQKESYAPLPGFKQTEQHGKTVWRGKIGSTDLTLHCAIIGKVLREGGWDLRKFQAKPVRSLIPAGSVFYCTVNSDIKTAIDELQAGQLSCNPLDTALGRGLITAAPWFKHDSIDNKENHS